MIRVDRPLSLLELNSIVKQTISLTLPDTFWIQAETSDVHAASNGHCYLEFIQKDLRSNALVARARATIWRNVYTLLRPHFEQATGHAFASGIKVQVLVKVEYHELYGLTLTVYDIDPTYTLGDLAQRRREILRKLEEEGVLTLNKELEMPLLPQRIAVISSATAAGYGDFCDQLVRNAQGYRFCVELFPAVMQGDRTEESLLAALDAVMKREADAFDVVVIIRGGGATSDLAAFDSYMLAAACAQFPLPIITGIGHERDDTVLDLVAHTRVKTPTAAAGFLIERMDEAAQALDSLADRLIASVDARLQSEKYKLSSLTKRLPAVLARRFGDARYTLRAARQLMRTSVTNRFREERQRLTYLNERVKNASPDTLLRRGYSLTLRKESGRAITDPKQVKRGDRLITRVWRGEIHSIVE